MSRVTVYILTTEGPVEIQRITEEDPGISSVMCLDGLAQVLPISAAYDAFVRRPVGVIERMTGHGAYRMDVAARIDEGRSWQLAAFVAHAAQMEADGDGITVFATGEVDSALAVRPVERVPAKLEVLARYLEGAGLNTEKAVILVPGNETGEPTHVAGIPVRPVMTGDEALMLSGVASPKPPAASRDRSMAKDARRRTPLGMVLLAAIFISAALFWIAGDLARWSALAEQGRILELEQDMAAGEDNLIGGWRAATYRKWRDVTKPKVGQLDVDGWTYAAGAGRDCADKATLEKQRMTQVYTGTAAVCSVEIRAVSDVSDRVVIGRLAYWPNGLGADDRAARVMRGSQNNAGRTWMLEFAQLPGPGAALRLVIVSGDVDIDGPQPWYQDLLSAPMNGAVFDAARARLQRLGFDIYALDWRHQ